MKGKEEASVVFLRATSYQHHHVFLKCAQDGLQGSLGAVDLTDAKRSLSKSVGYRCGCTVLFSHSLRGKTFETDGGALESEEMGPFSTKLLLISHLRHFYSWRPRLCDYLKSDHICVMQINKSFIAVDLVRTVMGMALNDFLFGR